MTKRDKLFDIPLDDETFEEQMDASNVEVVKPEYEWYKPSATRNNKIGLKDKVSLHKNGLTIGSHAIKEIGAESLLAIGVYKFKGKNVMALKPGKKGLTISRTKANSYRVGTKVMAQWLESKGIEYGTYKLQKVEGGFLCLLP